MSHLDSAKTCVETEGDWVAEVILPTRNERDAQAVRLFLAALPMPIALEYFGTSEQRLLLLRGGVGILQEAAALLEASFPRARVRLLEDDPTELILEEKQTALYQISLQAPPYLPIRTWKTYLEGDPVWATLSKFTGLHEGEALWLQIQLNGRTQPAWLANIQRRIKVETQRGFVAADPEESDGQILHQPVIEDVSYLSGIFYTAIFVLAILVIGLFLVGQWPISAALLALALMLGSVWGRLTSQEDPWGRVDLKLVEQKCVDQDGLLAVTIRMGVLAQGVERQEELRTRIEAALAQYQCAGGNSFHCEPRAGWDAKDEPLVLNMEELAGLWHLPLVMDQVAPSMTPVNSVETRSPHPSDVHGFYRIGEFSRSDGTWGTANIGAWAFQRSMALFGKPGQGKSMLMIHLALAAMQSAEHPSVVVVDPHGDLANFLIGVLAPEDFARVRILDVLDHEYLLTFNPLEMHTQGLSVEEVGQLIVDIGRLLWKDFWGPRMQIPLNRGVQALAAANLFREAEDQFGLAMLAKIVGGSHELRRTFLDEELEPRPEFREIHDYFLSEFHSLTYSMREQIVQPVLSKAHRFREMPLLPLLSCPKSMLDLGEVIAKRQILIVNTRLSGLGPELSDLIGSLLLNLLMRAIARQGERDPKNRVPVRILVDEFQTYTGVGWAEWEQQLRKWGGSVILGTQSLASLRATQGAELPGIITSGTGSLFTFAVNGEDAEYLARYEMNEKAGGPTPETLTNLPPFTCYARLTREDGSPGQPFTLRTAPPPLFQEAAAEQVRAYRKDYALAYSEVVQLAQSRLDYFERYEARLSSTGSDLPHIRAVAGMEAIGNYPAKKTGRERDEKATTPGEKEKTKLRKPGANPEEVPGEDQDLADLIANDLHTHFAMDFGIDSDEADHDSDMEMEE